jgi:hypothetical protein
MTSHPYFIAAFFRRILPFALGVAWAAGAVAQTSDKAAQPPSPLFAPRLPQGVACTETIRRPGLDQLTKSEEYLKGHIRIAPFDVARKIRAASNIVCVTQILSDGKQQAGYYTNGYVLVENQAGTADVYEVGSEIWPDNYLRSHFPELSWVAAKKFQGLRKWRGIDCYLYEQPAVPSGVDRVYVKAEGLLPVLYESPNEVITYAYSPDDATSLVLPDKLNAAYQNLRKNSGQ